MHNQTASALPLQLSLSGELTIYSVQELKSLLLTAVDGNSDVTIDMSEVSEVDTAGLQLVLLARKELESRGLHLTLSAANSEITDTLNLFGIQ